MAGAVVELLVRDDQAVPAARVLLIFLHALPACPMVDVRDRLVARWRGCCWWRC